MTTKWTVLAVAMLMVACGPKELMPGMPNSVPVAHAQPGTSSGGEVRKVLVHEVLEGETMWFLDVQELTGQRYWVATSPGNGIPGGTYEFTRGEHRSDFFVISLDRTFEDIYFVDGIQPTGAAGETAQIPNNPGAARKNTSRLILADGALPIAEVVDRAQELAGTTVRVTGVVTKVNPDIMNRNWIHLQDGSRNAYDFVATTDQPLPVGHTVTLEGLLAVDRDFGAGYTYDVILENGQTIR